METSPPVTAVSMEDVTPSPPVASPSPSPPALAPPSRRLALKGEDAWKRMNFLFQSAHHLVTLPPQSAGLNLTRFYLQDLRKVASKLVLRLDTSVKNCMCKRCGVLLVPGLTARTEVDENSARDENSAAMPAMNAEEASQLRQWRQQRAELRQTRRRQLTEVPESLPQAAEKDQSAKPVATAVIAQPTPLQLPSVSAPPSAPVKAPGELNAKQRRALRRHGGAETMDAATAATPAAPLTAAAAAAASSAAAAAISTAVEPAAHAPSVAAPAPTAAVAAPTSLPLSSPSVPAVPSTALPLKRRHRKRKKYPLPPPRLRAEPRVVQCCTQCLTRRRINTKLPLQQRQAEAAE